MDCKITIECGIPAVDGTVKKVHRKNDATVFDGITVPLIRFGVARDEKSPLLATTFQICESILEQGDELVIFEMSSFGGHFADYNLQQTQDLPGGHEVCFTRIAIPINIRTMHNVVGPRRWKLDFSLGIDVH